MDRNQAFRGGTGGGFVGVGGVGGCKGKRKSLDYITELASNQLFNAFSSSGKPPPDKGESRCEMLVMNVHGISDAYRGNVVLSELTLEYCRFWHIEDHPIPNKIRSYVRTRRIGANPEKSDLVNFRGSDWRTFSELSVLLFFLGKMTKCSQNPGLVNQFSATPRGQLNWTGPIANGSDHMA